MKGACGGARSAERAARRGAALLRPVTWLWPGGLRRAAVEWEATVAGLLSTACAKGGWRAFFMRWCFEAVDASRHVSARMRVAAVACVVVVVVVAAPMASAEQYGALEVRARDDAGEFTLVFRHGVLVEATVDSRQVSAERMRQRGDSVWVLQADGRPVIAAEFIGPGTVRWQPRPRRAL